MPATQRRFSKRYRCKLRRYILLSGKPENRIGNPNQKFYLPQKVQYVCVAAKGGSDFIMSRPKIDSRILIFAGAGSDQVLSPPHAAEILGQRGNDRLFGSPEGDLIDGGEGNDHLFGFFGNDVCAGGDGNDKIAGGPGEDIIFGDEGNDVLWGDHYKYSKWRHKSKHSKWGHHHKPKHSKWGNKSKHFYWGDQFDTSIFAAADEIHGGPGHDFIKGNGGDDRLFGDEGNDKIKGGKGRDVIHGGLGQDTLRGGKDDDTIYGGEGHDTLVGGDGNDELHPGSGVDNISGGDGDDKIMILDLCELESGSIIDGGLGEDVIYAPAHSIAEIETLGVTVTNVEQVVNVPPSCDSECRTECNEPSEEDWRAMCHAFCDRIDVCLSDFTTEINGAPVVIMTAEKCKEDLGCDALEPELPPGCDAKTHYENQRQCLFGTCEDVFQGCDDSVCE